MTEAGPSEWVRRRVGESVRRGGLRGETRVKCAGRGGPVWGPAGRRRGAGGPWLCGRIQRQQEGHGGLGEQSGTAKGLHQG